LDGFLRGGEGGREEEGEWGRKKRMSKSIRRRNESGRKKNKKRGREISNQDLVIKIQDLCPCVLYLPLQWWQG
jgi:hypothetical protein